MKKFAQMDKRKMLETSSEATEKLGLTNFKENVSFCRRKKPNLLDTLAKRRRAGLNQLKIGTFDTTNKR